MKHPCSGREHFNPKDPCKVKRCGCIVHRLKMWGSDERDDSLEPCGGFVAYCKKRGMLSEDEN